MPTELIDYKEAKMCTLSKFEEIELDKVEVTMIGDVVISEEEKSVLKLQHKFAVLSKLDPVEMETDLELGFGKGRYTLLAEIEGKIEDEEEIDDETRENSASADGGPCSRVRARGTLCSPPSALAEIFRHACLQSQFHQIPPFSGQNRVNWGSPKYLFHLNVNICVT